MKRKLSNLKDALEFEKGFRDIMVRGVMGEDFDLYREAYDYYDNAQLFSLCLDKNNLELLQSRVDRLLLLGDEAACYEHAHKIILNVMSRLFFFDTASSWSLGVARCVLEVHKKCIDSVQGHSVQHGIELKRLGLELSRMIYSCKNEIGLVISRGA